jgi:omega-amidase
MKLAIVQHDVAWEDKEGTKKRIRHLLSQFTQKADLMIFPEMTLSGFSMHKAKTEMTTKDCVFFRDLAKKFACTVMYGGIENGFNICRALTKCRSEIHDYRKVHLFTYAGEDKAYKSGIGCLGFVLNKVRITPSICYDLRFPYLYWSKAETTDLYVNIANWPSVRSEHWKTLLRARAIENQAFVVGVNRVGTDPHCEYAGGSMVFSPTGEILLDCGNEEGVYSIEIDINEVENTRIKYPFLHDRLR